jgi:hypothetical protein
MPGTRHGLNNGARSFWTKAEIEKMGYGTQKKRLGADSQLAFGDCALTLTAAVDPVVSPSGTIYSREAICKYLLAKTKELKKAKAVYKRGVAQEESAEAEVTQKRIRQVRVWHAIRSPFDACAHGNTIRMARRHELDRLRRHHHRVRGGEPTPPPATLCQ